MTNETKRALEIIKPIANELGIMVSADDGILYVNDIGIGISHNSTKATVCEFIGYLMVQYDRSFRPIYLNGDQIDVIKRYWFSKAQLAKLRIERSDDQVKRCGDCIFYKPRYENGMQIQRGTCERPDRSLYHQASQKACKAFKKGGEDIVSDS